MQPIFIVMLQPAISLFGLRIQEPVTSITDLMIVAICFFAAKDILQESSRQYQVRRYFGIFFVCMGMATLWGALIGHAFNDHFGEIWKVPGWLFGLVSIGYIQQASITRNKNVTGEKTFRLLKGLNLIQFALFLGLTLYFLSIFMVNASVAIGLLGVVSIPEWYNYRNRGDQGSKILVYGVLLAIPAAIVHGGKISLGPWFNQNDLAHVFMGASLWVMYQGVMQFNFANGLSLQPIESKI